MTARRTVHVPISRLGLASILVLAIGAGPAVCGQQPSLTPPPVVSDEAAPSGSLLVQTGGQPAAAVPAEAHGLRVLSMFALASPDGRFFHKHDLIQIVVRETSLADSFHQLKTTKEWNLDGEISAWPDFRLEELLQFMIRAGRTSGLPSLDIGVEKELNGKGTYKRQDDFTARLTAEVIEILPNGNLILEARSEIITDKERSVLKVTGICRAADVTPANTVLSNQLHDLKVQKINTGELRDANQKGIIAKVLDTIFAF